MLLKFGQLTVEHTVGYNTMKRSILCTLEN